MDMHPDFHAKLLQALGPLAALYSDPTAIRIYVDAYDHITADRISVVDYTNLSFPTPQALQQMIDDLLALYAIALKPGQSVIDLRLEEHSRMQIVLPPMSLQGPYVVIHKLPDVSHLTWEKLIEVGLITRPVVDVYQEMIYQHQNILVVGGKHSSKNQTAALLAGRIPINERVVVAEREHEMQINRPGMVYLEAGSHTYAELIQIAARTAPHWLVLGELAGPEAMNVMELLARGFYGIATLYANGVEDALKRLELMCLMANPGLGLEQIRVLIASALQVIIYQELIGSLGSTATQVVELVGVDEGRYLLQPLFTYNLRRSRLEPTGVEPTWRQKA